MRVLCLLLGGRASGHYVCFAHSCDESDGNRGDYGPLRRTAQGCLVAASKIRRAGKTSEIFSNRVSCYFYATRSRSSP